MKIKLIPQLPLKRALVYGVLLCCLPLFFISCFFLKERKKWGLLSHQLQYTSHLSLSKAKKQSINNLVRKQFAKFDPLYIEHQLQSQIFLTKEIKSLENLMQSPHYTGLEALEKRLAFLKEGGNRMIFDVQKEHKATGIAENIEVMRHPVEVDAEDLRKLLGIIEEDHPLKPQLVIRDFQITKKEKPSGQEVFELSLSMIQREYESW